MSSQEKEKNVALPNHFYSSNVTVSFGNFEDPDKNTLSGNVIARQTAVAVFQEKPQTFAETVEEWLAFEQYDGSDKNAMSTANRMWRDKGSEVERIV